MRNANRVFSNRDLVCSPETYYSRGTRGERVDVVTIYELETKPPRANRDPAERGSGAHRAYSGISFDGVSSPFNVTPAMSVSIVDVVDQTFVEEIDARPTVILSLLSLCGQVKHRHAS